MALSENDALAATRVRLAEIEQELAQLNEQRDHLKAQWQLEKDLISTIRSMKSQIEELKTEAANYERQGDLGKVAEIRYGKIAELEKQVAETNKKLEAAQQTTRMLKEEVEGDDIAEIVAKWTGIPVQRMLESERTKLLRMEDRLHQRVIGQDDAVTAVSNAIRRSRAGLQDQHRPIGSFIFMGTTGVGKTELARALAEFLFDDERAVVRIDMSEYMEKFSVSRLIGAPPGYVGYEEGGQLTEAVRRHPYSVVLLDEIEKAHPEVFNILLQVLDDGRLTDSKGHEVNFRNTIIIMTSNLGSNLIQERLATITESNRESVMGELRVKLMELLRQQMRPEFLNRIDDIIVFKPLTEAEIRQIVDIQIDSVSRLLRGNGIGFAITNDAKDWLAKLGYDITFGARPLKRVIQSKLINPISAMVLEGKFANGDTISVTVDDRGQILFDGEEEV
ncbi:MAG: AAA family ATPase [Chlorobi bacterium]|nr:AAA family ATPase [Chlorobiota bacterium]MBX7215954.1 AAA family ATPase [Candidatus Kapabacteria bacterium]